MANDLMNSICALPLWLQLFFGGLFSFVIVFLSGVRGWVIPGGIFIAVLAAIYIFGSTMACTS